MKTRSMLLNGAALLCLATACSPSSSESNEPLLSQQSDFYNLINVKNVPTQPRNPYVMLNLFADLGSWSGYALPENESSDYAGAFIGPMAMTGRGWVSATMAQPFIQVNGNPYDLARNIQTSKYLPGRLVQEFSDEQLQVKTELCFLSSRTVLVHSSVENCSNQPLTLSWTWKGGSFPETATWSFEDHQATALRLKDSVRVATRFITAADVTPVGKDSLRVNENLISYCNLENRTHQTILRL